MQLQLALDQNLQRATNLDQATLMNNSGLPFDSSKETQPRKLHVKVAPKESKSEGSGRADGTNIQAGTSVMVGPEQAGENRLLKVLSSSPHIIVCSPHEGSVSYVLLNSSLAGGGNGGGGERRGEEVTKFALAGNMLPEHLLHANPSSSEKLGLKGKTRLEKVPHHMDYDSLKFASRLAEVDLQGYIGIEGAPIRQFPAPQGEGSRSFQQPREIKTAGSEKITSVASSRKPQHTIKEVASDGIISPHSYPSPHPLQAPLQAPPPPSGSVIVSDRQAGSDGAAQVPLPLTQTLQTNTDENSVMMGESEMVDLSLNFDHNSLELCNFFTLPLTSNVDMGGNQVEGVNNESDLSPLSQLMHSLIPNGAEGEGGGGGGGGGERGGGGGGGGVGIFNAPSPGLYQHLREGEAIASMDSSHTSEQCTRHEDNSTPSMDIFTTNLPPISPNDSDGISPQHGQHSNAFCPQNAYPGNCQTPTAYEWESLLVPSSLPAATPTSVESHSHVHATSPHSMPPHIERSSPVAPHFFPDDDLDSLLGLTPDSRDLNPQLLSSSPGDTHSLEQQTPLGTNFLPPRGQTFLLSASQPAAIPPVSFENPVTQEATLPMPHSISPRTLSDIPEGVPMSLENVLLDPLNHHLQGASNILEPAPSFPLQSYRNKSPTPSSPSISSVSGHSTVSSLFDPASDSPSVFELCELLGESPNVQQHDFSNTTFTGEKQGS